MTPKKFVQFANRAAVTLGLMTILAAIHFSAYLLRFEGSPTAPFDAHAVSDRATWAAILVQ